MARFYEINQYFCMLYAHDECCMHMMNKANGKKLWESVRYGKTRTISKSNRGKKEIDENYKCFYKVSSDKDYGEHSWFTQKVYKNWISILHIRIYGICQRRKAEYTQSLQEIDEEYCEDFRMEIAAMVIRMDTEIVTNKGNRGINIVNSVKRKTRDIKVRHSWSMENHTHIQATKHSVKVYYKF
eukprot:665038_1